MPPSEATSASDAREIEASRYAEVDLNRLIVFVLGWLRDSELAPTFENVVVAAYRMFPRKFALHGFDYPDSNRVNRSLLQLGPNYRNWARGSTRTGFVLTHGGEAALNEVRGLLAHEQAVAQPKVSRARSYTWDTATDLEELRQTTAFGRYGEYGPDSMTIEDVLSVLNAYPYTPEEAIRRRLVTLQGIARDHGDDEVSGFTRALRAAFEAYAKDNGGKRRA